jgi:hypothetical protein
MVGKFCVVQGLVFWRSSQRHLRPILHCDALATAAANHDPLGRCPRDGWEGVVNQRAIEDAAGIDANVARHMMKRKTAAARNAMELLEMCVDCFEGGAFALLKCAVTDCRKEMTRPVAVKGE